LVVIFFVLCLFFVPRGSFWAPFCRTTSQPHHPAQLVSNSFSPFLTKNKLYIYTYICVYIKLKGLDFNFLVLLGFMILCGLFSVLCLSLLFFSFGCVFWLLFMFHFKQLAMESKTLAY
jgi:hypothetical protein